MCYPSCGAILWPVSSPSITDDSRYSSITKDYRLPNRSVLTSGNAS